MFFEDSKVVLWNPAIDELKVIPPSPVESVTPFRVFSPQIHGFGYDGVRDDYKVLRYVQFNTDTLAHGLSDEHVVWNDEPLWEIYSLRNNSWKKLDIKMPMLMVSSGDVEIVRFYMDGMCHWWTQNPSWCEDTDEAYLVSFDVSNEVFFTTPMPDDGFDLGLVESHLVMLNGYIALISYYGETATFYISILGEIGVKESWTKLFVFGSVSIVERPIGAGKKENIFFMKKDGQLACFDLGTKMIVELGFEGDSQIIIYKERLLSIRGIQN
jgi:molecular chaperone HtpG